MLNLITKLKVNKIACNNLLKFNNIKNIISNNKHISRNFATSLKNYEKLKEELNFEHEDEKDLRYEDQLFFLEREMDKLIKDKIEYGQDYATSDFPEYQQREITSLVEIVKNFDFVEKEYFLNRLSNYLEKACDTRLAKQNSLNLSVNIKIKKDLSKLNPNNQILDSILMPLIPYLASDIFIGGGGGAAAQGPAGESKQEAAKEEKKEEKPKEVIKLFKNL